METLFVGEEVHDYVISEGFEVVVGAKGGSTAVSKVANQTLGLTLRYCINQDSKIRLPMHSQEWTLHPS